MKETFLLGRVLAGGYFLYSGLKHFIDLPTMIDVVSRRGIPFPKISVVLAGVLLLIGGVSFLFGLVPKLGIVALTLFLVPVTLLMHPYWKEHGAQRMADLINLTKNFGLLGAVLMAWAIPEPWPLSIDTRLHLPRRI